MDFRRGRHAMRFTSCSSTPAGTNQNLLRWWISPPLNCRDAGVPPEIRPAFSAPPQLTEWVRPHHALARATAILAPRRRFELLSAHSECTVLPLNERGVAPAEGFEPPTAPLTAECSTTELSRNKPFDCQRPNKKPLALGQGRQIWEMPEANYTVAPCANGVCVAGVA